MNAPTSVRLYKSGAVLVGTDLEYSTHLTPSGAFPGRSSTRFLNECLLQLAHLLFEGLHLLPAIQRSSIVRPQTCHQVLLRLLHLWADLVQLLSRIELLPEVHDLLLHAVVCSIGLALGIRSVAGGSAVVLVEGR
jgi:hypothetical protein